MLRCATSLILSAILLLAVFAGSILQIDSPYQTAHRSTPTNGMGKALFPDALRPDRDAGETARTQDNSSAEAFLIPAKAALPHAGRLTTCPIQTFLQSDITERLHVFRI